MDTWDGSDIVVPESISGKFSGMMIVTKRVKTALEAMKATNIEFTPATKYEREFMLKDCRMSVDLCRRSLAEDVDLPGEQGLSLAGGG